MNAIPARYLRLCGPALVLGALGALLLPLYRYQINQDAITYISIAQKYARADWMNAVNGHAYPLISWIMAPLLLSGLDPLLTAKIISLAAGAVAIILTGALCLQQGLGRRAALLCQACCLPGILYFACTIVTPDLLLSAILLMYHLCVLSPSYSRRVRCGIACGIIGGLAYLTKSYGLLFFLVHFPLVNGWYFFKHTGPARKTVAAGFLSGMALFLAICACWSGVISMKYGRTTSSNQGSVIMSAISPHRWEGPSRLVAPPNATAVSIWEDPQAAFTQRHWSPFLSRSDFSYWLHFIARNTGVTVWTFFIFSPIGFCLCLWYAGRALRRGRSTRDGWVIAYMALTCALFAGGYCLLIAEERYLWPLFFLFALLSTAGLAHLGENKSLKSRTLSTGAVLIFFLSFAAMPAAMLYKNVHTGREYAALGTRLRTVIPPGSKLVFDTDWYGSSFITYHVRSQIYGTADNIDTDALAGELQRCAIDYFILWENQPEQYPFLRDASEIALPGPHTPRIFRLPHR